MLHKTITERIQDWIDTDDAYYNGDNIVYMSEMGVFGQFSLYEKETGSMCTNVSIYNIFFGPSNYWKVMFPDGFIHMFIEGHDVEDNIMFDEAYSYDKQNRTYTLFSAKYHQIQCLLYNQNGGTIEEYLNNTL